VPVRRICSFSHFFSRFCENQVKARLRYRHPYRHLFISKSTGDRPQSNLLVPLRTRAGYNLSVVTGVAERQSVEVVYPTGHKCVQVSMLIRRLYERRTRRNWRNQEKLASLTTNRCRSRLKSDEMVAASGRTLIASESGAEPSCRTGRPPSRADTDHVSTRPTAAESC